MIFLGNTFLGADALTISHSPTFQRPENSITISGIELDYLYITDDVNSEILEENILPTSWDFDTIMYADFDDNTTLAGNIDWSLDTVTDVAIKRRRSGEYKWITLAVQAVDDLKDFNIDRYDLTTTNAIYEYALVPIMNRTEGIYNKTSVDVRNDNLVISDSTNTYYTIMTNGFCNTVDNAPNATLTTIHDKYPTIIRNTNANYETIEVTGTFMPLDETECSYEDAWNDDRIRILYQRKLKEFLSNGKNKILRNVDGQTWLVYVTTPPSDIAVSKYNYRQLTFQCTEIADIEDEEALYKSNFTDVTEEWWFTS